jgi:succinate-acetate transporter protein
MFKNIPVNPLTAMGTFWSFFGIVLLIANFFVNDPVGKWTNFVCAMIFVILGIFTFRKGMRKIQR